MPSRLPANSGTNLMSSRSLSSHLAQKAVAMRAEAGAKPHSADWDEEIEAHCSADDITGVRRLNIRDWNLLSDGGAGIGGFNLGPSSPELLLGVISTCLTHTVLCLAALRNVSLESVNVQVTATNNDAGFFNVGRDRPSPPRGIIVTIDIEAPALTDEARDAFIRDAEDTCPLLIALRTPTAVTVNPG